MPTLLCGSWVWPAAWRQAYVGAGGAEWAGAWADLEGVGSGLTLRARRLGWGGAEDGEQGCEGRQDGGWVPSATWRSLCREPMLGRSRGAALGHVLAAVPSLYTTQSNSCACDHRKVAPRPAPGPPPVRAGFPLKGLQEPHRLRRKGHQGAGERLHHQVRTRAPARLWLGICKRFQNKNPLHLPGFSSVALTLGPAACRWRSQHEARAGRNGKVTQLAIHVPTQLWRFCSAMKGFRGKGEVISVSHRDGVRVLASSPSAGLVAALCSQSLQGELGKRSWHLLLLFLWFEERTG